MNRFKILVAASAFAFGFFHGIQFSQAEENSIYQNLRNLRNLQEEQQRDEYASSLIDTATEQAANINQGKSFFEDGNKVDGSNRGLAGGKADYGHGQ